MMALRIAVKCLGFRLGEEVGPVVDALDKGDRDLLLLDELADEEVATLNVLRLCVELGVVGDGDTRLVVHRQLGRGGGLCSRAPPGIGAMVGSLLAWPPRSPP